MDLGCLDLGCISVSDKCSTETNTDATENVNSATKTVKSKSPKGTGQSTLNALNKFTSQIKKPSHRKNSPINWFPRKKVDSYLKRKIKMLQEIDGMNLTLDETLGDSNPHYSRVLREKIAAREAAQAAMEARKAALVEASWCKILHAARIQSKEAEELLVKVEKTATEAFEAATALGVVMFDKPNYPFKTSEIETTHTVTASFETAFEVDKEVAAAVRTAFIRFTNCSSFNKEEFKELLCKISHNPNMDDDKMPEPSEYSSESLENLNFTKIVDMMVERLRCLNEEELSSLATIVATCGLSAALAEEENGNAPRRMSAVESANLNLDQTKRKQVESELPSLDKFLVKHMSKLEREVLEAKNSRKSVENSRKSFELFQKNEDRNSNETVSDLGSILVKHSSKLEKEIEAEKKNPRKSFELFQKNEDRNSNETVSDLGSILVKHSSKFEKEIEAEKKNPRKSFELSRKKPISDSSEAIPSLESVLIKHSSKLEKEVQEMRNNTEKTRKTDGSENRKIENVSQLPSLDKFLVKHVSRLEKEVQEAKNRRNNKENIDKNPNGLKTNTECGQSLDKVLVKHVSRLEKAKMEFNSKEERNISNRNRQLANEEGSLDQILVKHKSKLERAKLSFAIEQEGENRKSVSRREAREKELQEAWGGLGLGNSIKPHISRLERDKAAWIKAEEEQRRNIVDDV